MFVHTLKWYSSDSTCSLTTGCALLLRKSRGCCGLRGATVLLSIQVFLLLTCCQPTTFHLKHRASGHYTTLVCVFHIYMVSVLKDFTWHVVK